MTATKSGIWDVSVPVRHGGLVYPGNPPISITAVQSIAQGDTANVSRIDLGSHTGTHVDAPLHFMDGGAGVDELPLDVLVGPARLIAFGDEVMAVGEAELRRHDLRGVTRLLIKTRNSAWLASGSSEFHPDFTHVTPDGAEYLVSIGVRLVGVDYLSVEQFRSPHHKTHKTLLSNGVVIVEGLVLAEPPPGDYELYCLPILLAGLDGAPARAVLIS
ncbi:MAG TPA: cyclase family protein [Gemmatimonadaceae bacterium]|nr:cyclase family protein [Gemmatimonadaceae bacterium]